MYHREDGRYEYKRRDRSDEREGKDSFKSSSKRRNRWDEKGNESVSSESRWSDRRHEESRTGSSRESKRSQEWDHDGESSSSSHSRSRGRRSRSRSRSPFRRDYRDCANPTKDEHQNKFHNELVNQTHNQPIKTAKNTSWSDSSDEDDRSGKPNSNSSTFDYSKERKHEVPPKPSLMRPFTSSGEADNGSVSSSGISLKLGGSSAAKPLPLPKVISVPIPVKSTKVAAIFNADDDDEPEEMPAECKMRMKNVGRETKTSEGPNSFGKTKIGFCNMSHLAEKQLGEKPGANKKP